MSSEKIIIKSTKEFLRSLGCEYDRKVAAEHALSILGPSSPMVKILAMEVISEPTWTQKTPTVSGTYWHWNGDVDSSPLPTVVMYSGTSGKCFVSMGQHGLTHAIDCDEYGGWWKELPDPELPFKESPHA